MNDDKYGDLHAWIEPEIEARIVAAILGEASDFELDELERLMEERPELRIYRRRLEAVHGLIGEAVKKESGDEWKLAPKRRAELMKVIGGKAKESGVAVISSNSARERRIGKAGRRVLAMAAACLLLTLILTPVVLRITKSKDAVGLDLELMSSETDGREAGLRSYFESASRSPAEPEPAGDAARGMEVVRELEDLADYSPPAAPKTTTSARSSTLAVPAPAVPPADMGGELKERLAELRSNLALFEGYKSDDLKDAQTESSLQPNRNSRRGQDHGLVEGKPGATNAAGSFGGTSVEGMERDAIVANKSGSELPMPVQPEFFDEAGRGGQAGQGGAGLGNRGVVADEEARLRVVGGLVAKEEVRYQRDFREQPPASQMARGVVREVAQKSPADPAAVIDGFGDGLLPATAEPVTGAPGAKGVVDPAKSDPEPSGGRVSGVRDKAKVAPGDDVLAIDFSRDAQVDSLSAAKPDAPMEAADPFAGGAVTGSALQRPQNKGGPVARPSIEELTADGSIRIAPVPGAKPPGSGALGDGDEFGTYWESGGSGGGGGGAATQGYAGKGPHWRGQGTNGTTTPELPAIDGGVIAGRFFRNMDRSEAASPDTNGEEFARHQQTNWAIEGARHDANGPAPQGVAESLWVDSDPAGVAGKALERSEADFRRLGREKTAQSGAVEETIQSGVTDEYSLAYRMQAEKAKDSGGETFGEKVPALVTPLSTFDAPERDESLTQLGGTIEERERTRRSTSGSQQERKQIAGEAEEADGKRAAAQAAGSDQTDPAELAAGQLLERKNRLEKIRNAETGVAETDQDASRRDGEKLGRQGPAEEMDHFLFSMPTPGPAELEKEVTLYDSRSEEVASQLEGSEQKLMGLNGTLQLQSESLRQDPDPGQQSLYKTAELAEQVPTMPKRGTGMKPAGLSKLRQVVIPQVDFGDTTVEEAVAFLKKKTSELESGEPQQVTRSLDFLLEDQIHDVRARESAELGTLGGGVATDLGAARIKGFKLENVTVEEVLDHIAREANLSFEVEDKAVKIRALGADEGEGLVTRTYQLPPVFRSDISGPDHAPDSGRTSMVDELSRAGVTFSGGTYALYDPGTSTLTVRNSEAALQQVDTIVENAKGPNQAARQKAALGDEKTAEAEPFSTFSLHVSDVSFKLAHAALAKGEWPDAARVRVEEFVNALDYGDPAPSLDEKVACQVEQAVHPFLQQRNLLRVSMRTAALGRNASTPLRLTVLLDNSGSMDRADRVESVQKAFQLLAAQMNPQDEVTLVSFARTSRLVRDRVAGDKVAGLVEVVAQTPSEGGTNLEQALQLGLAKARENFLEGAQNRIVLLTDGAANLGNAKPAELAGLVETMRQEEIAFDACGVGAEGLNDEILESLTRKGDGRYYFLDRPEDADDGFAKQIAGALRPAAKNVKVQVEFNPKRVGRYKLLGFEKHRLEKEDFRNDSVDAAEMAAEEAGVAAYQFEAMPEGEGEVGTVSVRFQDMATGRMVERKWTIPYEANPVRVGDAGPSLQLAAGAAMLAEKLKGTAAGEVVNLHEVEGWTRNLQNIYPKNVRVRQLHEMTAQARELAP